MRYSKTLIVSLPVLLAGCLDFSDNDSETFYTPAPAPAPIAASAPVPATSATPSQAPAGCGCPESSPPSIPSSALPMPAVASSSELADWSPSEGHLVRAGDLVMELQRKNNGVRPTHVAMARHIQAQMGLSASQAEMVLEEMGL